MSNDKQPKCDSCNRTIRKNQHELHLTDALTGQVIGRYHAQPVCQERAVAYMSRPGAVLMASFVHPPRCGPEQQFCDGGASERAA